ncbi:cytochrome C oxidase subunit II [Virgibacillus phasianinus]|uniref:Cytochrome C oxidase subunit II n=1 Tax=Virgibacillus phasianinus TaxID=2017483 RepID=A0A220TZ85_9BACI|nr:cytochrome C oxidase subunit II [Virgibacillus phasianinus]ASK61099.1 cytochrome C oxidase subunit II [Virgibacillus phasianinus]
MKKALVTALLLSLILILAACGSSNEESSNDSGNGDSGDKTEQSADSSGDSAAKTNLDITATNFQFNKEEYSVPAGKEVTVSLTSKEGKHGLQIQGTDVNIEGEGKATFTIDEPGEYMIHCSVPCGEGHSDMMSTLVVK